MKAAWEYIVKNPVKIALIFVLLAITVQNFEHARYRSPNRVIEWDIKSYYAYLPVVFIYQDLSLEFRQQNMDKFGDLIWPVQTPTGKQAIVTSMGMSVLYAPFFFVAHGVALISSWEADGYSLPYRFALTFSALFYVWLGMIFLIRILRKFFSENVIAFTLLAITTGTNLFYYATYEAPMPHAYNFALITIFIWQTLRFYENPGAKRIFLAGIMAGFITLIRPTNIIVLLIFFLWDIKSFGSFGERVKYFIQRWHWVLIMAGAFILAWVPQFIYWHHVAGSIFYFSYGEIGGGFFWHNPQIYNILISYKKGWLVYTPLMIFSLAGIFMLPRRIPRLFLPILLFTILLIYILSSWWSWWFGGGFGLRAFIDAYGLLAIPLAVFIEFALRQKAISRYLLSSVLVILIVFNQFQIRQYKYSAIHWWWMNKEAYWETFLKLKPTERFWQVITLPDYDAARKGIYREVKPEIPAKQEKNIPLWKDGLTDDEIKTWLIQKLKSDKSITDSLAKAGYDFPGKDSVIKQMAMERINQAGLEHYELEMAIELIMDEMSASADMMKYLEGKARNNNITINEQMRLDAIWLYKNRK